MRVRTVRDVGALIKDARLRKRMTQSALSEAMGVSRDWVIRLEKGHPRLEAQLVFDALSAVDLTVEVTPSDDRMAASDAFGDVLEELSERKAPWPNGV
jgi:HTH-type transcriptional regulator / antitoxin HipB